MRADLVECLDDSWGGALLLTLSAVALGHALQISNGMLNPLGIRWLSVAFALCALAVVISRHGRGGVAGRWGEPLLRAVLLGGLLLQLFALSGVPPTLASPFPMPPPFGAALVAVGVLAVLGMTRVPVARQIWFPLVLILHAALAAWIIHSSPPPSIDVHMFQRDASNALASGLNPYTVRFPNIYGPSTGFYGPGLAVDGWLTFGFPYSPLSLLLVLPAQVLAGDFRYAHVAAVTCAGALIGYARSGPAAMTAACLYLFTPRVFHVLHQGWTEPLVVLLCAATVFCACRKRSAVPYAFGLLLAVKQYLVLAVPIAYVLAAAARLGLRAVLVRALLVAAVITLPFFAWAPGPFMESVVTLQFYQPFRHDALSYPAWLTSRGGPMLPGLLSFAAAGVALAIALPLTARTPAGTAAALAFVYFAFFAFNKQAFANYYFFVVGTMCCAVGAARLTRNTLPAGSPDSPRGE